MASTDPISVQKMAQFIDDVCPSSHISKNEGESVDNPTWAASTSCAVKLVGECSISDIRRNKCGSNFWHSSQKFPLNSAYREVKPLSSGLYALSCTRLRSISDKSVFGSSHDADQGSTTSNWKIHKDIQMVGILCLRYLSIPLYHYPRPASTKTRLLIPSSISSNFLDFCYLCKRRLDQGNDIFIYRGDRAFCSLECRCDYIILEEQSQMWSSSSSPSKSIIRSTREFNPSSCDL